MWHPPSTHMRMCDHAHTHTCPCTCAHVHTQPAQHRRNIMYLYFKNTTQLCGCWSLRKSDAPLGTPSAIPVVVGLELMIFNTGHYSAYTLITLPKYTAYTILVVAHHVSCQLWFDGRTPLFYCCIQCPWLATTRWESYRGIKYLLFTSSKHIPDLLQKFYTDEIVGFSFQCI